MAPNFQLPSFENNPQQTENSSGIPQIFSTASTGYKLAKGLGSLAGGAPSAPVLSSVGSTSLPASTGATLVGQGLTGGVGLGGLAAGAYTGYEQFQGLKGALKGEDLSLTQQAALALPTFGASLLYNPVKKALGIGHSQNYYDHQNREQLLNQVFKGSPQSVKMGPGTYDLSAETDKTKFNHQIDHTNPAAEQAITYFKPLAMMLGNGDQKMTDDLIRIFYNQTTDGGKVDENGLRQAALRVYNHFGLKPSQVTDFITQQSGLPDDQVAGLRSGVDALRMGGKALKFRNMVQAAAAGAGATPGAVPPGAQTMPQTIDPTTRNLNDMGQALAAATQARATTPPVPMGAGAGKEIPMSYNPVTRRYEAA